MSNKIKKIAKSVKIHKNLKKQNSQKNLDHMLFRAIIARYIIEKYGIKEHDIDLLGAMDKGTPIIYMIREKSQAWLDNAPKILIEAESQLKHSTLREIFVAMFGEKKIAKLEKFISKKLRGAR